MLEDPRTAPNESGALPIDETGDREDGTKSAHVGRRYLGGIGKKIDDGVVFGKLFVGRRAPLLPSGGRALHTPPLSTSRRRRKADPEFRTKPRRIALEPVERAVEMGRSLLGRWWPRRSLYGEHRKFKEGLERTGRYLILRAGLVEPSYAWGIAPW